ncbi:MAG: ornithine carbamoyltransferase [Candidatus Omnitrophica bacterium]|nr:ornithine carbamoyltransferase [Candidatus Omnitrophota bacterium]MDD5352689.1 ornithine carbamoyltransferase [Candidatus Omnitrophota bacterium]MDD5550288.1 ornithine carbamoyltransferase [Candidatus Omnitrophota bacterium]
MKKDFVSIKDLSTQEIETVFSLAKELKKDRLKFFGALKGKSVALIFQKPSNRTRVSFEVGISQLGGNAIYLKPEDINPGVRESIADISKTLSRYLDAIILRTFGHDIVLEVAKYASIPVINGLSDLLHPCQALSDIFTINEKLGKLKDVTLSYVGDGNNVCNCLLYAASKTGMNFKIGTPKRYGPNKEIVDDALEIAKKTGAKISLFNNPNDAVKNSDVIYTDVWASMGKEKEAWKRKMIFGKFQVNRRLVALAKPSVLIMHCLPAHRGLEITDEVMDSPNSIVFDQAENRLHIQKAILLMLLGGHK